MPFNRRLVVLIPEQREACGVRAAERLPGAVGELHFFAGDFVTRRLEIQKVLRFEHAEIGVRRNQPQARNSAGVPSVPTRSPIRLRNTKMQGVSKVL